ncbi:uncharacterized protein Z520_04338 [Fonsecaea multimorphosa CBS 102226]|uniref:NB-ARC domain-containing protein n=1 Tax=Fonsecaea multimorphosa CBS 102226 TaxID=1442371 RepID=A0A0D2K1G9_9EURO|nr:uncharacterized protein Z520_04338 [Fonsecaea multimorphosa CBS 102226]KIX99702.1 hypothetical protein Z520_04338 [Fonsecaea multimorphosa CBS 102226]
MKAYPMWRDLRSQWDPGRTTPARHYIPLSRNKRFVGREEVLEALRQQLFASDGGQKVSLVGLGGVGKTQVAFQIAYWTKENKPDYSVFWVSAMSGASFEQACTEISEQLEIRKRSDNEDVRQSLRQWLESDEGGKWLLVVDNADDMDILFGSSENDGIFQYLPESDSGLILFTTRFRRVAAEVGGEMVNLAEMSAPEAIRLLGNCLFRKDLLGDEKGLADLLQELTYLPLAITQAAAYINTTGVSISKYVELLRKTDQDAVELMSREFRDSTRFEGSRHAVATTWLVSFYHIRQSYPDAADLLTFLSCIEPKAIPRSILPLFSSEEAMLFALGTLDAYAFLVRRGDVDTFDMHRLVHLAARIWVRKEAFAAEVEKSALLHVTSVFPWNEWSQPDRWRAYLPHAIRLLWRAQTASPEVRSELCLKVGLCLFDDGRIKEAIRYFEECYNLRSEYLDQDHRDRLMSQNGLAIAYLANNQVKEAVALLEEVVRIQIHKHKLPEDHPERLLAQQNLAMAYQGNGQVKEAVTLLEEVVRTREQTLAEDPPDRLASQHQLAVAYQENGQVKEAVALLEEVVRISEQTLEEDHPDRLASQHNLAYIYWDLGQNPLALRMMRHVVKIRQRMLDPDHPARVASEKELGKMEKSLPSV